MTLKEALVVAILSNKITQFRTAPGFFNQLRLTRNEGDSPVWLLWDGGMNGWCIHTTTDKKTEYTDWRPVEDALSLLDR